MTRAIFKSACPCSRAIRAAALVDERGNVVGIVSAKLDMAATVGLERKRTASCATFWDGRHCYRKVSVLQSKKMTPLMGRLDTFSTG